MPKFYLNVDMDGVFSDWVKAMLKRFPELSTQDELNKLPNRGTQIRAVYEREPNFFQHLEAMPWVGALLQLLQCVKPEVGIRILTAVGPDHPNPEVVIADKLLWLKRYVFCHFPKDRIEYCPVLTSEEKTQYVHSATDILLDDFHRNVTAWEEMGGAGLQLDSWDDFFAVVRALNTFGLLDQYADFLTMAAEMNARGDFDMSILESSYAI